MGDYLEGFIDSRSRMYMCNCMIGRHVRYNTSELYFGTISDRLCWYNLEIKSYADLCAPKYSTDLVNSDVSSLIWEKHRREEKSKLLFGIIASVTFRSFIKALIKIQNSNIRQHTPHKCVYLYVGSLYGLSFSLSYIVRSLLTVHC